MTESSSDKQSMPLKDKVQDKIQQETLSNDQLNALLQMQESVLGYDHSDFIADSIESKKQRSYGLRISAIAASVVLLIAVLIQPFWFPDRNIHQEIALEVIENHLKLKPLDLETNSIIQIKQFFTQLDFVPVRSQILAGYFSLPDQSMLGGRYCSIKGVTAAQLRYLESEDRLSTLYEVTYNPELYGDIPNIDKQEKPLEIVLKGLQVSMWQEKGLLLVLVRDK